MAEEKKSKGKPERSVVSLELYGNRVKICEAVFYKKRNPLFRFITEDLPEEGPAASKKVANLFAEQNLTQRKVFLNIPRHLVMARIYRFPSVNDEEIKNMVNMEAVKHVPYRDEDIITGYRIIERLKDGYSEVLVAITEAGAINRLLEILQNAGLTVEKIALGSETLFLWYEALIRGGGMDSRLRGNDKVALVNIDAKYVNMDIIGEGKIVFARAFSYNPGHPGGMREITEEIKKSVAIYQKEKNLKIERILLSGAGRIIRAVGPLLKEEGFPSEELPQAEAVELAESAEKATDENSFPELVGLCLKNEEAEINLLPGRIKEDKEFTLFKNAARKTLVLLASAAILFMGASGLRIFNKWRLLSLLNKKIKATEPEAAKARRMRESLKIIKDEIEKRPLAVQVLSEIYGITPQGITFNLTDYESGKTLLLRGSGPSLDSIIKFISILENSEYFKSVKLKYTRERRSADGKKTDFEIVCLLSNFTDFTKSTLLKM